MRSGAGRGGMKSTCRRRRTTSATLPIDAVAVAASGLMPTRQLDKAELREAVQQAIGALGERQRMAVLLSKFEHFSYAEIAEVMDMSPRGGEVAVVAGADRLREVLEPYLSRGSRVESPEPELADSGPRPSTL